MSVTPRSVRLRRFLFVGVGIVATGAAMVLYASNMGFKLNKPLLGPGGTATGTNALGLPYKVPLTDAEDLINDLGPGNVVNVQRFDPTTDTLEVYTGTSGIPFALESAVGVFVQLNSSVDYLIAGTHDPGLAVSLRGPGDGTLSGFNFYVHPYHGVAKTATELLAEINGGMSCGFPAAAIQRWDPIQDRFESHDGCSGDGFDLVPGEAYMIVMRSTENFIPLHY